MMKDSMQSAGGRIYAISKAMAPTSRRTIALWSLLLLGAYSGDSSFTAAALVVCAMPNDSE